MNKRIVPIIDRKMLLISVVLLSYISSSDANVGRPRGVSISKASFYKPGEHFTCLDGSQKIPYKYVNDDYCDCKDGSDEPGTSACPNGFYHCTNAGHRPLNIPSSRVNDGICDCCDGSDEYSGIITCSNTCKELGKKAREEEEKLMQLAQQGYEVRMEYIKQGKAAKVEKQERMKTLEEEKNAAEAKMKEMEAIKKEVEDPETEAKSKHEEAWKEEKKKKEVERDSQKALEAFKNLDTNEDMSVSPAELMQHTELDKNSDQDFTMAEAKEYLEDNDNVDFEFFSTKVWPNIKEIFKMSDPGAPAPPAPEEPKPAEEVTPPPSENPAEPLPQPVEDLPEENEPHYDEDDDPDDEPPKNEESPQATTGDDADKMPEYDDETKKLIEAADKARQDYKEAEQKFRDLENEEKDLKEYMELDLGPNDDFYPLKGQCFEFTDREYTYKLCPYDKATQRSKNGGSETKLGGWGQWSGPETNKYSQMLYNNGQGCWNGPDRSCKVNLICGTTNELLAASEPSRCEYAYRFQTPAACEESDPNKYRDPSHDEL